MKKTKQELALETFNDLENFKCDMRVKYGVAWQTKMVDEDKAIYDDIFSKVRWQEL